MKTCSYCTEAKPLTSFHNKKGSKDGKQSRCIPCNKEASSSMAEAKRQIKTKAVQYKGGSCELCGYDNYQGALEFHHRDPFKKDFHVSGSTVNWEKLVIELNKCSLLCSNCHKEVHAGLRHPKRL